MSRAKKILAMIISLTMIMGMMMTTFATGLTGTVTVNLPEKAKDAEVTYTKIVEPDTSAATGWKFSTSAIKSAFEDKFGTDALDDLIALYKTTDTAPNGNAQAGGINSSSDYSKVLKTLEDAGIAVSSATANPDAKIATFTADTAGLYLIIAKKEGWTFVPMVAYVGQNDEGLLDATVTAKGAEDTVTKELNDESGKSVSKGDQVTYTARAQYPFYSPSADTKIFEMEDTVTNATFESLEKVHVKIGGTEVASGFTKTISPDKTTLKVVFTYDPSLASKKVEVSYTVIVGDVSSANPLGNKVISKIHDGSTEARIVSDTVTFKMIKYGDNDQLLGNAKFTLYEEVPEETAGAERVEIATNTYVFLKMVETKSTIATAGVDFGTVLFDGLDAHKTYYVQETEAPAGYSKDTTYHILTGATEKTPIVTTTVEGETKVTTTTYVFDNFEDMSLTDTALAALPSTGGMGTTLFTIGGCAIMLLAAAGLLYNRKKTKQQ